jgi:hypothetical protein
MRYLREAFWAKMEVPYPEVISVNVELTSHLLDGSSFGDLSTTIDAMDQTFSEPVRQPSAGPAETSAHRPSATEKLSS